MAEISPTLLALIDYAHIPPIPSGMAMLLEGDPPRAVTGLDLYTPLVPMRVDEISPFEAWTYEQLLERYPVSAPTCNQTRPRRRPAMTLILPRFESEPHTPNDREDD